MIGRGQYCVSSIPGYLIRANAAAADAIHAGMIEDYRNSRQGTEAVNLTSAFHIRSAKEGGIPPGGYDRSGEN